MHTSGYSVATGRCSLFTVRMASVDAVRELLARDWGLTDVRVTEHMGGMNSATWWVHAPQRRWVAKSVPATAADDFVGGLAVAARLQAAGIPAGAAVPTLAGATTVPTAGTERPLALLEYVPGVELSGTDDDDVRYIGTTLGRVHMALRDVQVDRAQPFLRIDLDQPFMGVRGWIRPAVAAALDDYAALEPASLTHGLLHTDPAPEAFRCDRSTGVVGVIDWSVAMSGPLLYDVASVVMYIGGLDRCSGFIDPYLATGVLSAAEIDRGLATMLRFRGAVQAMYFAWRTANNDLTGINDAADNEKGLADARAMLA